MRWSCFLILFLLPVTCFAQYVITGKVLNSADKTPVANASVFLNNAVAGSKTDDKGAFTITNVRSGQYDLVVSSLGFETSHQNIMINGDIRLTDIGLAPKIMMLQEVHIKPKGDWAKNYEKFKQCFFGNSAYAQQCKILNKNLEDLLDLDYNSKTRVFTARSADFLEIENKALGYKIRYLLQELKSDGIANINYYEGTAAFEELKGSTSQIRKWKKNRLSAYEGSSMHFLRSVIANNFNNEGFKVLRLIRKPNPDYKGFGAKYNQTLVNTPMDVRDFVKVTDVTGEYALSFSDCLYVMYDKKRAHISDKDSKNLLLSPDFMDDPLTTTLIFNEQNAFFDNNGIIINPLSLLFDGNWGRRLIAELLPVDYVLGNGD
ncbi:carboxypeptidase-like regulatory domain-containing protein [Mucilaginibacter sp. OK098]|uniref:carboxypeptidase-like regulatory domain-containing protein n=1 Tax=Mucilaginibacter sp. OK098 TaxID=1855297 RepID=UPI00092319DA|nr:carboxypeptidase-like regulatory domain-containing protein [Mucilaginibacter sp. OK098]SHN16503.1 CarboxypepD_reg-like domain-containing protein [Mucilaginibacter sp. OK098]